MSKAITSQNPLKTAIVQALKKVAGCDKVTSVKEVSPELYCGHCLRWSSIVKRYFSIGTFYIRKEDL